VAGLVRGAVLRALGGDGAALRGRSDTLAIPLRHRIRGNPRQRPVDQGINNPLVSQNVLFGQAPVGRLIVPARARSQAGLRRPEPRVGGRLRSYWDDSPRVAPNPAESAFPARSAGRGGASTPPGGRLGAPLASARHHTHTVGGFGAGVAGKTPPD
jgi:hypothetical protein